MSFFSNAQKSPIHIQDASLVAVGGDQQNSGFIAIAGHQHFAGSQNIFQAAPLKGLLSLLFIHMTV